MVQKSCMLILVRHGETEWNAQSRLQGHVDIPLSDRGHAQASRLATALAGEALVAVYSSDLDRARQTARPAAAALGLPVREDPRLRERAYGQFEGHTWAESQERWPAESALLSRRTPDGSAPGGESYLQLRGRVLEFLGEMAHRHAGERIAIVTHGGVLDVVFRAARGIPWETPRAHQLPNAAINRALLRPAGGPGEELAMEIESWAETSHLDPDHAKRRSHQTNPAA